MKTPRPIAPNGKCLACPLRNSATGAKIIYHVHAWGVRRLSSHLLRPPEKEARCARLTTQSLPLPKQQVVLIGVQNLSFPNLRLLFLCWFRSQNGSFSTTSFLQNPSVSTEQRPRCSSPRVMSTLVFGCNLKEATRRVPPDTPSPEKAQGWLVMIQ